MAPYRRARTGFLLAGIVGGAGVLFVLLFSLRQRARVRELARERDAQRRLVEEMQKVESFRRDFIADVSHEIKTPLTGIIGSVDLLASGGDLPPEAKNRLLGMLKLESGRLNDLVQGILSLARLERDAAVGSANFAPADLSGIVHEVVDRLALQAKEKGVVVRVEAPESCVAVCDGQLMFNAISNLVANAVIHSGSDEVSVALSCSDGSVLVSVEDHGVGIAPELRNRVFDRFFRVDRSRDSGTGGTGLGLAIVREIARLHGGEVTLDGVEPSGCRFAIAICRNHHPRSTSHKNL
jgi:signal transduction histidine kinase